MIATTLALISVLNSKAAPQWDIALCARFYYPVSDRRKSVPRIYLMTLDGKRKREIGDDPRLGSVGLVEWKDRDNVVWIRQSGNRVELRQYTISTGKRKTLLSGRVRKGPNQGEILPADVQRFMDRYRPKASSVKASLDRLTGKPVVEFGGKSYPVVRPDLEWKAAWGFEGVGPIGLGFFPAEENWDLNLHGSFGRWKLLGSFQTMSAHEGILLLFRVDTVARKAYPVPADVVHVSTRPKRDLWVGASERDLGTWAETDVWTRSLSVGKISQGNAKRILTGRVFIYDVSLRP